MFSKLPANVFKIRVNCWTFAGRLLEVCLKFAVYFDIFGLMVDTMSSRDKYVNVCWTFAGSLLDVCRTFAGSCKHVQLQMCYQLIFLLVRRSKT